MPAKLPTAPATLRRKPTGTRWRVEPCPFCGGTHHHGYDPFEHGDTRHAHCGGGRYTLIRATRKAVR